MKKLFPLLALVLMISHALPAYAAEAQDDTSTFTEAEKAAFDSVKLSEEEKSAYAASPEDTVIKIYARHGIPFLNKGTTIYEVLRNDEYQAEYLPHLTLVGMQRFPVTYYMSIPPEGEPSYALAPVDAPIQPGFQNYGDWTEISQYILDPSLLFGTAKVSHVYCICASYSLNPLGYSNAFGPGWIGNNGMYVYYETAKGDFVLMVNQRSERVGLYVLSAEQFNAYTAECYQYSQNWVYDGSPLPPPTFFGYKATLSDFMQSNYAPYPCDSVTVSREERESLSIHDEDKPLLKVFCNSAFFDGGMRQYTLQEIAAMEFVGRSGSNNRVTHMYFTPTREQRYTVKKTVCAVTHVEIPWTNRSAWDGLYDYAVNPASIFGESIEVKNVYCFTEDYTEPYDKYGYDYGHGCAIYYVTSAGDFVLYTPNTNEENGPLGALYMFTAEEFFEYTSLLGDECARERREGKTEYTRSLPEAFGFASHLLADFTLPAEQAPAPPAEPTPEPVSYVWIPVTAGVLVVLGGACAIIFIRKRKNK